MAMNIFQQYYLQQYAATEYLIDQQCYNEEEAVTVVDDYNWMSELQCVATAGSAGEGENFISLAILSSGECEVSGRRSYSQK